MRAEENDPLRRKERFGTLLRLYGALLPAKVLKRMQAFYEMDYSLSEIAENEGVSRNAVHLSLKEGEKRLTAYEKKLGLDGKRKREERDLQEALKETKPEKKDEWIRKALQEVNHGI
jgi:hypothetical protein